MKSLLANYTSNYTLKSENVPMEKDRKTSDVQKMPTIRASKKYCTRNESYCNTCAEPINEREEEDKHTCRGECCLYCNKEHKTGDKQKCKEYKKETEI